jgi:ATP-dependent DNA helicase RecG
VNEANEANMADTRYPEMESALLEFKREVPKNDQIIKTIIGFCNQKGGQLVLGEELKWQSHGIDFEKLPVYQATLDAIDENLLQQFLKSRKNHAQASLSQEVMRSYSLTVEEHQKIYPTYAGILLFGKEPQYYLSEAMIICCHFKGVEGREALASIDCTGTLLNQYYLAHNFILSRLSRSFTIQGMQREETLEIPEVAFREALLNLLIHRNYHLRAPSKVFIYDDRVEFFSPGGFQGPIKPEHLLRGITYLRNPSLCKIFRELGLVEKMGTGFIQIFNSYEKWGLEKPQIIEGENFVKCILPRPYRQTKPVQASVEQSILSLFYAQAEISIQDVMNKCGISRATAQRWLQLLIDQQKIERKGKTRNIRYRRLGL